MAKDNTPALLEAKKCLDELHAQRSSGEIVIKVNEGTAFRVTKLENRFQN